MSRADFSRETSVSDYQDAESVFETNLNARPTPPGLELEGTSYPDYDDDDMHDPYKGHDQLGDDAQSNQVHNNSNHANHQEITSVTEPAGKVHDRDNAHSIEANINSNYQDHREFRTVTEPAAQWLLDETEPVDHHNELLALNKRLRHHGNLGDSGSDQGTVVPEMSSSNWHTMANPATKQKHQHSIDLADASKRLGRRASKNQMHILEAPVGLSPYSGSNPATQHQSTHHPAAGATNRHVVNEQGHREPNDVFQQQSTLYSAGNGERLNRHETTYTTNRHVVNEQGHREPNDVSQQQSNLYLAGNGERLNRHETTYITNWQALNVQGHHEPRNVIQQNPTLRLADGATNLNISNEQGHITPPVEPIQPVGFSGYSHSNDLIQHQSSFGSTDGKLHSGRHKTTNATLFPVGEPGLLPATRARPHPYGLSKGKKPRRNSLELEDILEESARINNMDMEIDQPHHNSSTRQQLRQNHPNASTSSRNRPTVPQPSSSSLRVKTLLRARAAERGVRPSAPQASGTSTRFKQNPIQSKYQSEGIVDVDMDIDSHANVQDGFDTFLDRDQNQSSPTPLPHNPTSTSTSHSGRLIPMELDDPRCYRGDQSPNSPNNHHRRHLHRQIEPLEATHHSPARSRVSANQTDRTPRSPHSRSSVLANRQVQGLQIQPLAVRTKLSTSRRNIEAFSRRSESPLQVDSPSNPRQHPYHQDAHYPQPSNDLSDWRKGLQHRQGSNSRAAALNSSTTRGSASSHNHRPRPSTSNKTHRKGHLPPRSSQPHPSYTPQPKSQHEGSYHNAATPRSPQNNLPPASSTSTRNSAMQRRTLHNSSSNDLDPDDLDPDDPHSYSDDSNSTHSDSDMSEGEVDLTQRLQHNDKRSTRKAKEIQERHKGVALDKAASMKRSAPHHTEQICIAITDYVKLILGISRKPRGAKPQSLPDPPTPDEITAWEKHKSDRRAFIQRRVEKARQKYLDRTPSPKTSQLALIEADATEDAIQKLRPAPFISRVSSLSPAAKYSAGVAGSCEAALALAGFPRCTFIWQSTLKCKWNEAMSDIMIQEWHKCYRRGDADDYHINFDHVKPEKMRMILERWYENKRHQYNSDLRKQEKAMNNPNAEKEEIDREKESRLRSAKQKSRKRVCGLRKEMLKKHFPEYTDLILLMSHQECHSEDELDEDGNQFRILPSWRLDALSTLLNELDELYILSQTTALSKSVARKVLKRGPHSQIDEAAMPPAGLPRCLVSNIFWQGLMKCEKVALNLSNKQFDIEALVEIVKDFRS